MNAAWNLVTPATVFPLTLEAAKRQCRLDVDLNADDEDTERRLRSATRQAEEYLGRGLTTQTWAYAQDCFTGTILLPRAAPLQTTPIAPVVTYYDTSGVLQTLSTSVYLVDARSEPGRLHLAPGQAWPAVQAARPLAVIVTYVVGWADVDDIPADIVDAVALLVGDRDANRENAIVGLAVAELPNGVTSLLANHRLYWQEPCGC